MKKTYPCLIVLLSTIFLSYNCYAQYGTVVRVAGYYDMISGALGGFGGDGHLATDTSVRFSSPGGISLDSAGDIFIFDASNTRIRKVDHATGIITTIAGNGINGFLGDGGPGPLAEIDSTYPTQICADPAGNCYFPDLIQHRIRKIDHINGKITTVAGNGIDTFTGDGGLAINAGMAPEVVYADADGNLYISANERIRKVDVSTGMIHTIAGTGNYGPEYDRPALSSVVTGAYDIKGDKNGNIYFSELYSIKKIDTSGMLTTIAGNLSSHLFAGDGGLAPAAILNLARGIGVDSADNVYFSDADCIRKINASTGIINKVAGAWFPFFNGFTSNADSITMNNTYIWVTPAGNIYYVDDQLWTVSEIIAPGSAINKLSVKDTLTSAICSLPATISFGLTGTLTGAPAASDSLSISVDYGEFATNSTRNYTIPYSTSNGFGNIDSLIGSYTYHIPGVYSPEITLCTIGGYTDVTHAAPITVGKNCNMTGIDPFVTSSTDTFISCVSPATVYFTIKGYIVDTPSINDSMYIVYQYDENDTSHDMHIIAYNNVAGVYYFSDTISHVYQAGYYKPQVHTVTSSGKYTFPGYITPFFISNCTNGISLGGIFYMDENLDCIHQPNEVVLGYWPYALINNTIGDTTYGWCDDSGRYSIALIDGDNYTLIANPDGYFNVNGMGDSLHAFCPASGTFTVTALAGNSYTQDFAFSCSPPAFVDMSVNGWGWGYVPGDTGIIGIWSGSPTGYICDSLYATITLTLDPLLTYLGMWDGPAPTYISGDTLSWTFATVNDLFDFDAHVKIFTATTAAFATPVCNTLYVTSSQLIDPDTINNGYSWCEPVKSSWDPNEKQVSPQGGGTPGYIPMKTPLSYLIHFQNTGTAPARNIAVRDTISPYLDISTLQIISSSAPVAAYQDTGNVIRFQFNNINLPDSTDNLRGSTGYIAYNIGPKAGLVPGTKITNDAGIYFDYNPAVVTNTTVNTYEDLGAITGPALLCVGTGVELSDTTFGGGVWSTNNGNATISQTGFIFGINAGYVTVSYTVPGIGVATKIINVQPMPSAGTIAGPANVCIDSTITLVDTVQNGTWTSSNGNAVVNNGKVYGNKAGLDTITYQVSNLCATRSISKVINVGDPALCSSGVLTINANHGLEIFPNPASTEITIKTNGRIYNSFSITNSVGQILREQALLSALTTVNVADLAPGIYFFVFKSADGKEVKKFVKL
ncbi:MAG: T9SS type A sorting domain-containing protein [Flavipsychrobacter sp.]|nr:T9SS type A sorting domain-containing protein [Flavipsychrobacter sp.]